MSLNRDYASVLDIDKAISHIIEYVEGYDRASFFQDSKTQSAVIYQIAIIGEATKRLSQEYRTKYPEIAWSLMAGMRDKLVHDYDNLDLERIWMTVSQAIPDLSNKLKPLLDEINQSWYIPE
ncbi:MAG: hypothetical protein DCF19_21205 [Pseudanabaena frigida]|uniref:DUF86 domain-containing protein n=1 Tax=Pseudanabaena frigida TaxID=945775 RepID=A0A2W4VUL1_9CYAN|nr:MAG: hypothetical protein DCF19_21205 [Pseudanabaena frigida]